MILIDPSHDVAGLRSSHNEAARVFLIIAVSLNDVDNVVVYSRGIQTWGCNSWHVHRVKLPSRM